VIKQTIYMHTTCLPPMSALAKRGAAFLMTGLLLFAGAPDAAAQGRGQGQQPTALNIIPTINEVVLNDDGELVALGTVSVTNKGKTTTVPVELPVNISLAEDQSAAEEGECPVLDLEIGPIDLNILGLVVETSPICLTITAYDGQGLLGDLLCDVSDLLGGGLPLDLGQLADEDLANLLDQLQLLLDDAMGSLATAEVVGTDRVRGGGRPLNIVNLELGPVDLTLLGLNVHLDDCEGGPVTVDITARRGQLLGNLLSGLLGGRGTGISVGDVLGDIVDDLLGATN